MKIMVYRKITIDKTNMTNDKLDGLKRYIDKVSRNEKTIKLI